MAPPEHVHEIEKPGHGHALIHRHLVAHDVLPRVKDNEPVHVEGDDEAFLTLSDDYSVPVQFVLIVPNRSTTTFVPPPPVRTVRMPTDVDILIHGPPRAPSPLRAPPQTPAL